MANSKISVTEGSGKNIATFDRTVSSVLVQEQVMLLGHPHEAAYVTGAGAISVATANDHLIQIMAGSSLNVYITRIAVFQAGLVTSAAIARIQLLRLTTAGTGGTATGFGALDTSDAAGGATGMTLPSAKGTESTTLYRWSASLEQTAPTAGASALLFSWDCDRLRTKPIRIGAGTSNGICLKNIVACAGATVDINVELFESAY